MTPFSRALGLPPDRVLVFVQNKPFLGAQIVQMPFFHYLRRRHPSARLVAVATSGSAAATRALKMVDEVISYGRGENSLIRVTLQLRRLPVIAVYQHRRHSIAAAWAAWVVGGGRAIGFADSATGALVRDPRPFDKGRYLAETYVSLLDHTVEEYTREMREPLTDELVFIPGGSRPEKKYSLERLLGLAADLRPRGRIVFVLGPDMNEEAAVLPGDGSIDILRGRPLLEVADRVRRARLVITNDCGPGHFAHIFGVPRISLFGSGANTAEWFRPGPEAVLLAPPQGGVENIPVALIREAALRLLGSAS